MKGCEHKLGFCVVRVNETRTEYKAKCVGADNTCDKLLTFTWPESHKAYPNIGFALCPPPESSFWERFKELGEELVCNFGYSTGLPGNYAEK